MPDRKKLVIPKKAVKKAVRSQKTKHDEWVVDKLTEVVSILEEHDRTLKRIKTRMGL
tara:strand:- start:328 stop:498 length:171 start_codon:yes stop_codon:yes gene_type:complete